MKYILLLGSLYIVGIQASALQIVPKLCVTTIAKEQASQTELEQRRLVIVHLWHYAADNYCSPNETEQSNSKILMQRYPGPLPLNKAVYAGLTFILGRDEVKISNNRWLDSCLHRRDLRKYPGKINHKAVLFHADRVLVIDAYDTNPLPPADQKIVDELYHFFKPSSAPST